MRFMMIVKHAEKQGPPPKELMDAIAKLAAEDAKTGTMIGSGGLGPTALGARVRLSGGKVTVTDGPFTEAKEVVGGYAQFELKSKEEAIEGGGALHGTAQETLAGLGRRDRGSPDVRAGGLWLQGVGEGSGSCERDKFGDKLKIKNLRSLASLRDFGSGLPLRSRLLGASTCASQSKMV